MAENSKIEWTDHTFNPWIGCTKVSSGCANCYAETLMDQRYGRARWGKGNPRVLTSDANWRKPLAWNRDAEAKGIRYRVFSASLADVFDVEVADEWRDRLMALIEMTPNLDWLLLTKRPENAKRYLDGLGVGILSNVWLGVSVEDQKAADERIPILLRLPAAVRFLSVEPLLGPLTLSSWFVESGVLGTCYDENDEWQHQPGSCELCRERVDWVIVGGESGHHARSMAPEWVRSLRDQCSAADVAFHFKQWGEFGDRAVHGERSPSQTRNGMVRVGKKVAGRLLDGRTWDQLPTPHTSV